MRGLKLDRFRNLAEAELVFSEQGHVIIGDNGQGKTNFLEAVYYLTLLRSFRNGPDSECIRFGESHFHLKGVWEDDGGQVEELSVGYDGRRKKVVLSGVEKARLSEVFGVFKSVLLTPDDILLVQEGPAGRRRYLDIVLSIKSKLYLERLKRYKRALSSRNALLRGPAQKEEIYRPWEVEMADSGAWLVCERAACASQLAPLYEELFKRLSNGECGALEYRSDLLEAADLDLEGERSPGRLKEVFYHRLLQKRNQERERGTTLSGPQTDDLYFSLAGRPLRNYGSQGQQRTAVISLKMAEAELLRRESGIGPVLLLDDIFAELDRQRSASLLEELVRRHQSFVTAPRREALFKRLGHLPVKYIAGGVIADG